MRFKLFPHFLFLSFCFFSCENDSQLVEADLLHTVDYAVNDFELMQQGDWIACGGNTWEAGFFLQSSMDSIGEDLIGGQSFFDVDQYEDHIYAGGIYTIGVLEEQGWSFQSLPEQHIIHQILLRADGFWAVGGAGLSTGVIYRYPNDLAGPAEVVELDRELTCIAEVERSVFVGGYGGIYEVDSMLQYQRMDVGGDDFIDLEYDANIGLLALGATGLLVQSRDFGETWEELRKAEGLLEEFYTDMKLSDDMIYLAHDNRIIYSNLKTIDWKIFELKDIKNINKIDCVYGFLYFATANGEIGKFAL